MAEPIRDSKESQRLRDAYRLGWASAEHVDKLRAVNILKEKYREAFMAGFFDRHQLSSMYREGVERAWKGTKA